MCDSVFPITFSKSAGNLASGTEKHLDMAIFGLHGVIAVATVTSFTGFQLLELFKVPLTYYPSHHKAFAHTSVSF